MNEIEITKEKNSKIDKTALSPYDCYCDGYGMPGSQGNGYVSVLKVSENRRYLT